MERISQLMDGELGAQSARGELNRLRQDQALRERWDVFHLIGDTLRGEGTMLPGFGDRFAQRLTQEPTVLAPRRRWPVKTLAAYAMSAAASLAAVAWVGWFALGTAPMVAPVVAPAPPPERQWSGSRRNPRRAFLQPSGAKYRKDCRALRPIPGNLRARSSPRIPRAKQNDNERHPFRRRAARAR